MKSIPFLTPTLAALVIVALCATAQSGGQTGVLVRLQPVAPGTAQTGHVNISGNIATTNLGVGTSTPDSPLHVIGNVKFGGAAPHSLAMFNGSTSAMEIGVAGTNGQYSLGAVANDVVIRNNANRSLILQAGSGFPGLTVTNANRVGIGTSNPEALLHVRTGTTYFDPFQFGGTPTVSVAMGYPSTGWNALGIDGLAGVIKGSPTLYMFQRKVGINAVNPGFEGLFVDGAIMGTSSLSITQGNGGAQRVLLHQSGDFGRAQFSATDTLAAGYIGPVNSGIMFIGMLNTAGSIATGGVQRATPNNVTIYGTTKSFVEVNPDDPRTDIWYASLEGPEAAMYCRGSGTLVNGRARIDLPDHFRALAQEGTLTVLLTPNSFETPGLGFGKKSLDGIEVGELNNGQGNYDFDWEVKAVRKRTKDFKVIRPWTNRLITGADPKEAWKARLKDHEDDLRKQNEPLP